MARFSLPARLFAKWLGTAFLVATVVGSGIMGERLADGNAAIALLANTLATGAILIVLILVFGDISGAHFNPAVTLAFTLKRALSQRDAGLYVLAQLVGGVCGVVIAHLMFDLAPLAASTNVRTGAGQWLAEFVAAFGLVATILGCLRARPAAVPYAVGLFISAGYWFTSSTSFANPAVAIARMFTDSFSGIRPVDTPAFIAAELLGAIVATVVFGWLTKPARESGTEGSATAARSPRSRPPAA